MEDSGEAARTGGATWRANDVCNEACCARVYSVAAGMVEEYMVKHVGNGTEAFNQAKSLHKRIEGGERSQDIFDKFEAILEDDDASDVTKNGAMWTQDDAQFFACCSSSNASSCPVLEDLGDVAGKNGPCHVDQGDIVSPDCKGNSSFLLEAALTGRRWGGKIWPKTSGDQTEIAYCFTGALNAKAKQAFEDAVQHAESQVPCLKFKALATATSCTNKFDLAPDECCSEFPSILVQSSQSGCFSMIGQVSGQAGYEKSSQPLNLGTNCEIKGIAAHEIAHALGMLHEMARNDRNLYLNVRKQHVKDGFMNNFENTSNAYTGTSFDFLSLMMYGAYHFSKDGEMTTLPHDKRLVPIMGQREGFSELDVLHLGNMYGCVDTVNPGVKNQGLSTGYLKGEGFEAFKGVCEDATDKATGYTKNVNGAVVPQSCSELKTYCRHTTQGATIRSKCPVSCFICIPGLGNGQGGIAKAKKSGAASARLHELLLFGIVLIASMSVASHHDITL
jgi:hypothetical protein